MKLSHFFLCGFMWSLKMLKTHVIQNLKLFEITFHWYPLIKRGHQFILPKFGLVFLIQHLSPKLSIVWLVKHLTGIRIKCYSCKTIKLVKQINRFHPSISGTIMPVLAKSLFYLRRFPFFCRGHNSAEGCGSSLYDGASWDDPAHSSNCLCHLK